MSQDVPFDELCTDDALSTMPDDQLSALAETVRAMIGPTLDDAIQNGDWVTVTSMLQLHLKAAEGHFFFVRLLSGDHALRPCRSILLYIRILAHPQSTLAVQDICIRTLARIVSQVNHEFIRHHLLLDFSSLLDDLLAAQDFFASGKTSAPIYLATMELIAQHDTCCIHNCADPVCCRSRSFLPSSAQFWNSSCGPCISHSSTPSSVSTIPPSQSQNASLSISSSLLSSLNSGSASSDSRSPQLIIKIDSLRLILRLQHAIFRLLCLVLPSSLHSHNCQIDVAGSAISVAGRPQVAAVTPSLVQLVIKSLDSFIPPTIFENAAKLVDLPDYLAEQATLGLLPVSLSALLLSGPSFNDTAIASNLNSILPPNNLPSSASNPPFSASTSLQSLLVANFSQIIQLLLVQFESHLCSERHHDILVRVLRLLSLPRTPIFPKEADDFLAILLRSLLRRLQNDGEPATLFIRYSWFFHDLCSIAPTIITGTASALLCNSISALIEIATQEDHSLFIHLPQLMQYCSLRLAPSGTSFPVFGPAFGFGRPEQFSNSFKFILNQNAALCQLADAFRIFLQRISSLCPSLMSSSIIHSRAETNTVTISADKSSAKTETSVSRRRNSHPISAPVSPMSSNVSIEVDTKRGALNDHVIAASLTVIHELLLSLFPNGDVTSMMQSMNHSDIPRLFANLNLALRMYLPFENSSIRQQLLELFQSFIEVLAVRFKLFLRSVDAERWTEWSELLHQVLLLIREVTSFVSFPIQHSTSARSSAVSDAVLSLISFPWPSESCKVNVLLHTKVLCLELVAILTPTLRPQLGWKIFDSIIRTAEHSQDVKSFKKIAIDGLCAFLSRVPITFDERVSMVSSFFTLIGACIKSESNSRIQESSVRCLGALGCLHTHQRSSLLAQQQFSASVNSASAPQSVKARAVERRVKSSASWDALNRMKSLAMQKFSLLHSTVTTDCVAHHAAAVGSVLEFSTWQQLRSLDELGVLVKADVQSDHDKHSLVGLNSKDFNLLSDHQVWKVVDSISPLPSCEFPVTFSRTRTFGNDIVCPVCDSGHDNSHSASLEFSSISVIFSLIDASKPNSIRLAAVNSLFRLLRHCRIDEFFEKPATVSKASSSVPNQASMYARPRSQISHTVCEMLLNLLHDESSEIRELTAISLPMLLENGKSVSEESQSKTSVHNCGPLAIMMELTSDPEAATGGPILAFVRRLVEYSDQFEDELSVRQSIVQTIGSLGCVASNDLLQSQLLFALMPFFLNSDFAVRSEAYNQIARMAAHRKLDPAALFNVHRADLYPRLFSALVALPTLIDEVCEAIIKIPTVQFVDQVLHEVLPQLCLCQNTRTIQILAKYRNLDNLHLNRLFGTSLPSLLAHIILCRPDKVELLEYMKNLLRKRSLAHLLVDGDAKDSVILEIMWQSISVSQDPRPLAEKALHYFCNPTSQFGSTDFLKLANSISDNFLQLVDAFFRRIDSIISLGQLTISDPFRSSNITHDRDEFFIKFFNLLLELMSTKIDQFIAKSIVSLRTLYGLMQKPETEILCLNLWRSLILQCSADALGASIPLIVVEMGGIAEKIEKSEQYSSLSDSLKKTMLDSCIGVIEMFFSDPKYAAYIGDIPTLPDIASLTAINQKTTSVFRSMTLIQRIETLIRQSNHEVIRIRSSALHSLIAVLQSNRKELEQHLLSEGAAENLLSRLISMLLNRCSDSDPLTSLTAAAALGEIGAIDPGLINATTTLPSSEQAAALHSAHSMKRLEDQDLCIHLLSNQICALVKSVRDNKLQNRVALAAQDLLKFVGCTAATPELYDQHWPKGSSKPDSAEIDIVASGNRDLAKGLHAWSQFTDDVRSTVQTYLKSHYQYTQAFDAERSVLRPIFRSIEAIVTSPTASSASISSSAPSVAATSSVPMRKWLSDWCRDLYFKLPADRHDLFHPCLGLMKTSVDVTRFLLPYFVEQVIFYGTHEDRSHILLEINAVLSDDLHNTCTKVVFELLDLLQNWYLTGVTHNSVLYLSAAASAAVHVIASPDRHDSVADTGSAGSTRSRKRRKLVNLDLETKQRMVFEFIDSVSLQSLSDAAYRCGAFARALRYRDAHIRRSFSRNPVNTQKPVDLPDSISSADLEFLSRVYAQLDDPDGIQGVSALRRHSQPSLRESIREFEAAGQWAETLTLNEHGLMLEPQSLEFHEGLLNSQRALGLWSSAISHATFISQQSDSSMRDAVPVISARAIPSAWRSEHWSSMQQLLSFCASDDSDFDVELGRLLLSIVQSDDANLTPNSFRSARQKVVRQLSRGAAMESYSRAYFPHCVRLHMIADLEQFWLSRTAMASRVSQSQSSGIGKVMEPDELIWESRLMRTQDSYRVREPLLSLRRVLHSISQQLFTKKAQFAGINSSAPTTALSQHPSNFSDSGFAALAAESGRRVGTLWLQLADMALNTQQYQASSAALVHASRANVPGHRVQMAKLLHCKSEAQKAIALLQTELDDESNNRSQSLAPRGRASAAESVSRKRGKSLLLMAGWKVELSELEGVDAFEDIKDTFLKSIACEPAERPFFLYAKFLDRMHRSMLTDIIHATVSISAESSSETPSSASPMLLNFASEQNAMLILRGPDKAKTDSALKLFAECLRFYGNSLAAGHQFIFESLPRMLTLWFEYHDMIAAVNQVLKNPDLSRVARKGPKETAYTETSDMQSARSYIRSWVGQQPHYQWMTVLPQLLSRVTHSDDRVFEFITTIIGKVFQSYPDHAVWSVLPLKRFRRTEVKIRQLLELVIKESPLGVNEATLQMRFNQEFVDNVLTLCHELPPATINAKQPSYKMQKKNGKLLLALERLRVGSPTNPNIRAPIVPLQSFFTVNLPTNGLPDPNFTGFSEQIVRFDSFNENIEVLKSKERPKKIAVVGTDGRQYNFLCKREQRGDMRKDSRLMEFATVMNRLFRTDPQARRRPKLNFRTYSVFPMTEECGLIEWVPQTRPFRHILTDLYSSIGVEFDFKLIRSMFEATLGPDKKTRILSAEINMLEQLNKMFSPVFSRWFVQTFPDPGAWLEARSAFTVSTASWSIMGAMVGLGDRHGENLLINLDTGSLVQVDFDCLFDKGEELAAPERVPFRLTPNMIDAFGVLGIEGTYRRACEVTMSVIHQNRDLLYNVLQAFINDPLVEWEKSPQPSLMGPKQPAAAPDPNALKALQEYALVHLQKIDRRLRGMIGKDTAPVSVRRQVDYLINEATSKANLARMFIGWMSWL